MNASSFDVFQQQYRDVENSLMRSTVASVNVGDHDEDGMDFVLCYQNKYHNWLKITVLTKCPCPYRLGAKTKLLTKCSHPFVKLD